MWKYVWHSTSWFNGERTMILYNNTIICFGAVIGNIMYIAIYCNKMCQTTDILYYNIHLYQLTKIN